MKKFNLIFFWILITISAVYSHNFWEKTNDLDGFPIYSLAMNSDGEIFAGSDTSFGLWRSTDNGVNWVNLNLVNLKTNGIAIKPSGEIFLITIDHNQGGGVFRSTDNGSNWTQSGFFMAGSSIAINPGGDIFVGTLSSGVYRSTDDGNNWGPINSGLSNNDGLHPTSLLINSLGHIFTGTIFGGVFRSTDNGDNWVPVNLGLTTTYIQSLAVNANGHIFTGTSGGGVYRSTDNGENWVQINSGLAGEALYVSAIEINQSGDVFIGTAGGIFRSTDNGENWIDITAGLTNDDVRSLTINTNGDIFAGTQDGVFRTIPSANMKIFLQGPYVSATGTMNTTLNTNGYIPLAQPYNTAPWNYTGTESVDTIPAGVVDWILLELRSDLTTQVSRRAAFLLNNGSVVDLDGVSNVKFPGVAPGDYYTVIRHRNHLAVMTANPVTLSFSPVLYDFSTAQTQAYGTVPLADLGSGRFGLIAGDGNANGGINIADRNLVWRIQNGTLGYLTGDFDLSSGVNIADRNLKWRVNNGKLTQVPN
ncbi:MAG: hypothetical protein IPM14_04235 [bacterium]|nr:hypothetical protein [bacterium]